MPQVKQYLRYKQEGMCNVIGNSKSNVKFLNWRGIQGMFCAVGICENVAVWNLKTSEKVATFYGEKEVTCIAVQPSINNTVSNSKMIAVGYSDGNIKLFDLSIEQANISFEGHKSAITCLEFDKNGMKLISGSFDTNIVVWDIVAESGLYKLKGHKDVITRVLFLNEQNVAISCSKDSLLKFWDLSTQHCFRTLVDHTSEIWDMCLIGNFLLTGSVDSEIRIFCIKPLELDKDKTCNVIKKPKHESDDDDDDDDENIILDVIFIGSFLRESIRRVKTIISDHSNRILCVHGTDSQLEIFRISNELELQRLLQKRKKLSVKRSIADEDIDEFLKILPNDRFKRIHNLKLKAKIQSCHLVSLGKNTMSLVCLLGNNSLHSFKLINFNGLPDNITNIHEIEFPGHRKEPKYLKLSYDGASILSLSNDSVRLWNREHLSCWRSFQTTFCICCVFAPGDRQILVGTSNGEILIYDIAISDLIETIKAHDSQVNNLCLKPNMLEMMSVSNDKMVKFWLFEQKGRFLTIEHKGNLLMPDGILCSKYSPDSKMIALSLLDSTVKILVPDTLKLRLNLYGHSLPVVDFDFSFDSKIIATASSDRKVRIWNTDFGDCKRAIFAHDGGVSSVVFVPNKHFFFTSGYDGTIKEWDGDKFERIQTLKGHFDKVLSLAISASGNILLSCSQDRSIRIWEKSDDPLVLSEEREKEREDEEEEELTKEGPTVLAGENNEEVSLPAKRSGKTIAACERLIECLDIYKIENNKHVQYKNDCKLSNKALPELEQHPILKHFSIKNPIDYVLKILIEIKSSELEDSLIVLPFTYVEELLLVLAMLVHDGKEIQRCYRCLLFLYRIHNGKLIASPSLLEMIYPLLKNAEKLTEMKERISFNISTCEVFKQLIEEKDETKFFTDAVQKQKKKKNKGQKGHLVLTT